VTRAHGSHAKYAIERCRCEPCRKAQRDYNRNRLRQLARPDGTWCPYVDAGPAREHIEWLRTCGVGIKTVAKLTGISHGTLSKLMYGDPQRNMRPSKRIRPATAEKVLAVMPAMAAGGQKVPAGATWRLLDDLIGRGWSRAELARRLGTKGPGLQVRHTMVRASTARAVELLHAELVQMPVIPRKTRWGVVPVVVLSRRQARGIGRAIGERRFPFAPLAEVAGMSESALCLHLGLHLTRAREGLDECQADELATRLGLHPLEVWGDVWMAS
jgi:hypothetical protein